MRRRSALTSALTAAAGLALVAGASTAISTQAAAAPSVAEVKSARSTKITVHVSRKRVAVGERFVVRGKVRPKAPGKVVKLQRLADGRWKTVKRDRLDRKSRYRFVRKMRTTGSMRLRVVRTSHRAHSKARVVRALKSGRPAASGGSAGVSAREKAVLRLTNEVRAKGTSCGGTWYGPAPALTGNARLALAAQRHSDDMVRRDYFDHTSPDGDQPWDRAERAGYSWSRVGENIAWGYDTPEAVVDAWVRSEGHCRNLMNPDFKHLGVGSTGSEQPMWVQLFGSPL